MSASPPVDGVYLGPRVVPVPCSISPAAQAALRQRVGVDGVPLNARHVMPAVEDVAAWQQVKAASAAWYAAALAPVATRLQSQCQTQQIGTATVHVATPPVAWRDDAVVMDLHGGGLVMGGGEACRIAARQQADRLGLRCLGVDYRLPPEHPYPAALDDCLHVYRALLAEYPPARIALVGRSAGGNLATAMLLRARDEGLPMPAGLVLLSPQVDLTESGDSFAVNHGVDVMLPGSLMANHRLYAAGAALSDPGLSPLFGRFDSGFPPTFLQSGTRDLFLSNAVRLHRRLRMAGVAAELHVFEAMPHGGFGATPEDDELAAEITRFVHARLDG
ncbi:alpha/beta hydrolase [Stenotrophomonas sp. 24(2023)]|uniref:alpha/beta hydrolase n=1 Tax=Stenotrophomonas sp. 24(2023) TaxID=3068324 RepID=UPI0027E0CCF3|nr:alpha/beta hydrolase [Stenotrophomonas sp. 24(2023)]WMJ68960.1 alpha/beta hydrolase [Stenotrophomonas sp. 24(2023)]